MFDFVHLQKGVEYCDGYTRGVSSQLHVELDVLSLNGDVSLCLRPMARRFNEFSFFECDANPIAVGGQEGIRLLSRPCRSQSAEGISDMLEWRAYMQGQPAIVVEGLHTAMCVHGG